MICLFSYAGKEEHALVVIVDYNASGMLRDGWVTSQVTALLDRCRELTEPAAGRGPGLLQEGLISHGTAGARVRAAGHGEAR